MIHAQPEICIWVNKIHAQPEIYIWAGTDALQSSMNDLIMCNMQPTHRHWALGVLS